MKNRFHEFSFNQKKTWKRIFVYIFMWNKKKPHAILYTYISPPPPCTPNLYLMTTALKISFVFLSFWFLHFPFDVSCLFTRTLANLCWWLDTIVEWIKKFVKNEFVYIFMTTKENTYLIRKKSWNVWNTSHTKFYK